MRLKQVRRFAPWTTVIAFLTWPALAQATGGIASPDLVEVGSTPTEEEKPGQAELKYAPAISVPVLAAAVAVVVLPGRIYETPPRCRWCDGSDPNLIDRWARGARWQDPCRAAGLSNWGLGLAGAVALLPMSRESRGEDWLVNTGAVADSVAATLVVTQVVKYAVRRERPSSSPCHPGRASEQDRNLSFFSGHTAIALAMVSAARETARLRGHPRNSWMWIGGAASVLTGYLRVAGDRHHLIDVVAGGAVGFAIGIWVPRHLHSPRQGGVFHASPSPPASASLGLPLLSYSSGRDRAQRMLVGKGPGRSVQISIAF